jgi:threonine dehydratase
MLTAEERANGVWTISAGNAGQGVAYAAREAGIPCTVVVIETAPETKIERMRNLGATLVRAPFDACWNAMEARAFPGVEGTFVHPFDDQNFVTGNATLGLEILEDLPNVRTVITAIGGGGLISGVGSAIRALAPTSASSARSRRRRRPARCRSRKASRRYSKDGRRRSSTAPAARASSRACGSGCRASSTARSSSRSTR